MRSDKSRSRRLQTLSNYVNKAIDTALFTAAGVVILFVIGMAIYEFWLTT